MTRTVALQMMQTILPNLFQKVESFEGTVWMTKDTHPENYLETQEGQNMPVEHCIKGTNGWEFPEVLADLQKVKTAVWIIIPRVND